MEKIIYLQEAIQYIAWINLMWGCCFWSEKVEVKKLTINRLKWVMVFLDILVIVASVTAFTIEPYFLFADWVIAIPLVLAGFAHWLTIKILRERADQVPVEKQMATKISNWLTIRLIKLDRMMTGEIEECPGKSPEHSEK